MWWKMLASTAQLTSQSATRPLVLPTAGRVGGAVLSERLLGASAAHPETGEQGY